MVQAALLACAAAVTWLPTCCTYVQLPHSHIAGAALLYALQCTISEAAGTARRG